MLLGYISNNPFLLKIAIKFYGFFHKVRVRFDGKTVLLHKHDKLLKVNTRHLVYAKDLIDYFNDYHGAVVPEYLDSKFQVDYSKKNTHQVPQFPFFKLSCPSISEDGRIAVQYIDLLEITSGSQILDIGAYNGTTSLLFALKAEESGLVLAIEPDMEAYECLVENIEEFASMNLVRKAKIIPVNYALSNVNGQTLFNAEGSTGSFIVSTNASSRKGNQVFVTTKTLMDVVIENNLHRIDALKLDVEGSEFNILSNFEFFQIFHPKVILEPINNSEEVRIVKLMNSYGYKCQKINQFSSNSPLLVFK